MKRFVTYIYEYDRGARGRNVGFVRTDIRNDGCRMDLHIRGVNCPKAKATIYFVIANAPVIGIPVAEMIISQGTGQAKLMCPQGNIGSSGYHTDQIDAIVIRYPSSQILVSSFVPEPDEEVLRGNFRMWDEPEPDTPVVPEIDTPVVPENNTSATAENDTPATPEEASPPLPEESVAPVQTDPVTDDKKSFSVHTPESVESTPPVEILPDTPPDHTNEKETQPPEETITRKRIEITGIRDLPRANWYLCNNSFLVHGFFNYHYLLLKTVETGDKKRLFLGVPGIYEQPERMMALIFGFAEFEPDLTANAPRKMELSGDHTGVFGYWMCELLP